MEWQVSRTLCVGAAITILSLCVSCHETPIRSVYPEPDEAGRRESFRDAEYARMRGERDVLKQQIEMLVQLNRELQRKIEEMNEPGYRRPGPEPYPVPKPD